MIQTSGPLIDIQDLVVEYGAFRAVDGLSFKIHQGETLAIVGESGSGKSTTAMAIMRLLDGANLSGRVMLQRAGGSVDLLQQPEQELRKIRGADIAMVFQEPMTSLNPVMTIGAQISEAIRLHQAVSRSDAEKIALESLRRSRLTDPEKKLQQYPHQLSGGMRQRVMIAMALACRPSLLIADEPTTALDVTVQAEMLGLIRDLQQEIGMAVAYITHDLSVVAQIADHVIVMRNGKMVESQQVLSLFNSPQQEYTKRLLASVPVLGSASEVDEPVKFDRSAPSRNETCPCPNKEQVLEVRGLCKSFVIENTPYLRRPARVLQAVDSVSFDLFRGETIAVVGESGSGKSTMARTVMQLLSADSGSVKLHNTELVGLKGSRLRPYRANMQMVFQDPYASLNPKMTIGDLIAEPLIIHGHGQIKDKADVIRTLLESVGLPSNLAERSPRQLSGGQRQRVCIARALATAPSVIVLDEAVSALDVTVQAQIVDLLIDLQREKALSYLFISHDMGIVERISHRVAVMHMGRIVEFGGKRQVLQSPAHPYTRRLLSAVLRPDPSQRHAHQHSEAPPAPSAIRLLHEQPRSATYTLVGENHFVLADS
ncbi:ABC transporter ATP-binding protein [Ensifer sp. YR511]|uniref:ABC transporter ATP-binding protein n=1 Tax=Ensifer sp. YR511 TaxID=1855294 RepID=UPI000891F4ED|nr:ABC transporter ATP-binding protein [Ensifer sp. YR511]SDN39465.1 glutathione transport system ATP-binding protein [Ensifer sp. YR511]